LAGNGGVPEARRGLRGDAAGAAGRRSGNAMNARKPAARAQRGAALILVLWVLVLLIGTIAIFALGARTEGLQGRTLSRSADARYAAEAGIEVAAFHLQNPDGDALWVPDGRPVDFNWGGQKLQVRVVDEGAKVDLNIANPELLA